MPATLQAPMNQVVDDARGCLVTLSPRNVKTLQDSKQVQLSYAQVQQSSPALARSLQQLCDATNARHRGQTVLGKLFQDLHPASITFHHMYSRTYTLEIAYTPPGNFSQFMIAR
jgi:hypothetical protein